MDLWEDNWFIYIYGVYTNRSGSKKFKVDKVKQFDIKSRIVKELMAKEYRLFMKFAKENIFPDDLYWGP